jgi:hypothetical protein
MEIQKTGNKKKWKNPLKGILSNIYSKNSSGILTPILNFPQEPP